MGQASIDIRATIKIVAVVALAAAVVVQGFALREEGRKVATLEAQARSVSTQNVQTANTMLEMNMAINKSLDDVRKRLDKIERDVVPAKP